MLAEDHRILRQGIRMLLDAEKDLEVIGEAASGEEAVRLVKTQRPDVLVTDIVMDGMSGIEVAEAVGKHSPGTRVVVLSVYSSDAYVSAALENGALAYVVKGCGADKLVHAIREAMSGRRYLSPPLEEKRILAYRERKKEAALDS